MKIITSLLCIFLLSSCGRVEKWKLEVAETLCAAHKGVSSINLDPILWDYVICMDGSLIKLEAKGT